MNPILPYVPVFAILGLSCGILGLIGWIFTTWYRVKNGYPLENSWGKPLYPQRPMLLGPGPLFPFAASPALAIWPTEGLALGMGVLVGLEAALLSVLLYRIEDGFHQLPVHWMWWPALGGIVVGIGGLIDARVLGAGYTNIKARSPCA